MGSGNIIDKMRLAAAFEAVEIAKELNHTDQPDYMNVHVRVIKLSDMLAAIQKKKFFDKMNIPEY